MRSSSPSKPTCDHYLRNELYQRVREDESIFAFIEKGSLDGLWYWDLEKPEQEWMSENFWKTLGYDPAEMPHLSSAWKDIIFAEDLAVAVDNFEKHCADPSHPYDQIVRYHHKDGSTVLIADNGRGFPQEQASTIFQPFKRLYGSDSKTGSGLGLSICEKVIQAHGGRIWAESRPGEGATFHFTLPDPEVD